MKRTKLLPLLLVLALTAALVGCASTNEPADMLSSTLPAATVPAATTPTETAPTDGILSTEVPDATVEPTATPEA